ncbi:MAG: hypothetical protein H7A50_17355, partial [Akkermansiaceae bacterium]|nr:hypothetical protein [Akkermansiaceae bacterium]
MRTILPALIGAALVSCEKPADDVTRRLNELEQRAEAAEARSEQLEQQAAEAKLADERDAIERERMSMEEERIQLVRMQDDTKAEAERKLEERERALAARETKIEQMQDELGRSLDDADDMSRQLDERDRELAGREALATVREETAGEPVADYDLFYDSLSSYGSWFSTPQYGYVWQPVVVRDVSWRPYTRGRWVCTDHGWTWVSDEPFGWATYHYGRWALVAGRGWVWIPGSEWAPAWVCWRYGSSHIGWAPLPPESLAYRHWAWDANIETTLGIGSSWFCFVETRNFCEPVRRHCLPYSRHRDFWNHTRNVTRFQHVRGRTICGGPSYGDVSRQTSRPIPFYRLETDRDGRILDRHPQVSKGKLRMHAPNVDVAWNAGLHPKNLRGTWSDVAIQRDRQPEADVRKRFEETRVKDRQRAEQTIQRLGGPEKFPAKRREELTANREKRNPERQTSGRETQRRETPPVAATERRRTTGPSEETKKPTRVETPRKKDESETRKERNVSSNDRDTRKPQLPPGMVESRQESRGPTRPVAPRDPGQRK